MISTNWSLRVLACRVFGTVMISAMMAVTPGALSAEDRDVNKFYKVLEKIPQPVIDPEEVRNAIRKGEAARRRVETKRVVKAFEKDKQEWRDLVQRLDQELEKVDTQAERDAQLRAWATFFQIVSLSASLIQEITESEVPADTPPSQAPSDSAPPEDSLHIQEQHQRVIKLCKGGTCETIELREVINKAVKPSVGVKGTAIRQMRDKLYQATAKLSSLRCDLGGERCVPLNTTAVVETMRTPSSPALAPPTISSIEKPTIPGTSSSHQEKQVFSLLLDLSPAGRPKALVEAVTGEDMVTHEEVSRLGAVVGVVAPGGKNVIKGGKAVSKVVKKVTRSMAKRHIKSVEDILTSPDLLRNKTLKEVQGLLGAASKNWRTEKLGKGVHKGQGWKLVEYKGKEPTGRMIRYHPGGGHHGRNPYWRVNDYTKKSEMIPAGSEP